DAKSLMNQGDITPGSPGQNNFGNPAGSQDRFVDVKTGKEIRTFGPADKIYGSREYDLIDGIRPDELSVGRWFRGVVTGRWDGAEAEKRVMSIGDASLGGWLIPAPISDQIVDLARNQTRVIQSGALIIPMSSPTLTIAKWTKDVDAQWLAENQEGTFSDFNLALGELKVKKLAGLTSMSVELFEDAANLETAIRTSLSACLALALDHAALYGIGAGAEPCGIRHTAEIQLVDAGGALTNYDDFSEAWQNVQEKNGPAEGMSVILAPRTIGELDRLKVENKKLEPPDSWGMMKKFSTNQIPMDLGTGENESEAFVGQFRQCLIGMRTDVAIEISRTAEDAFKKFKVLIRAYLRADVIIIRPDWLCVVHGITPPA
ncbi:unnamed protein product, partial [marine sediment metagenome]